MTQRIAIVGVGYTGTELARQALARSDTVVGTTRSSDGVRRLASLGVEARTFDVLADEPEALRGWFEPGDAVVYSVGTLFREYADDTTPRRHVAPVVRVFEAAEAAGADRFVYLSSTSVYGDHGGRIVDEESERRPSSPYGQMRRDIEDALLARSSETSVAVARIVGIYGPGRNLAEYLRRGRFRLVDGGRKLSNRIHVADLARTILAAVDRGAAGPRVYLVADGHPFPLVELVDWMVEHLGVDRPPEVSLADYRAERGPNRAARWHNEIRASNHRIREELGVELAFPDVFSGYRAIFADDT